MRPGPGSSPDDSIGRCGRYASGAARSAVLVALLALAACAAPPIEPSGAPTAPSARPVDQALADFEQRLTDRAQAAAAQRRWGDAVLAFELLELLRPDDTALRERLVETRARARAAVAEQSVRAAQAAQRGDLEAASQRWLAVLALDPGDATAANALRQLEVERNRKTLLGRHAGTVLTRRVLAEAEALPDDEAAEAGTGGSRTQPSPRRAVARSRTAARLASAASAAGARVAGGAGTAVGVGAVAPTGGGAMPVVSASASAPGSR